MGIEASAFTCFVTASLCIAQIRLSQWYAFTIPSTILGKVWQALPVKFCWISNRSWRQIWGGGTCLHYYWKVFVPHWQWYAPSLLKISQLLDLGVFGALISPKLANNNTPKNSVSNRVTNCFQRMN